MLAWSEPCVATATGRRNRRDVSSEDREPFRSPALFEPEPREPKEHGSATARVRKALAGPASLSPPAGVARRNVQPEEHRVRTAEVREVRLRQSLLRPTRPWQLSDPRLRVSQVRPRRGPAGSRL